MPHLKVVPAWTKQGRKGRSARMKGFHYLIDELLGCGLYFIFRFLQLSFEKENRGQRGIHTDVWA
jgi:hypothetical protein